MELVVVDHNLEPLLDLFLAAVEHSREAEQTYPDVEEHIHDLTEHNHAAMSSYQEAALDLYPAAVPVLYQGAVAKPNLEEV